MSVHTFRPSLMAGWCMCGKRQDEADHGFAAVARRTDPETSWEAAQSITSEHIRRSQQEVLALFQAHGPMTDETARRHYAGPQSLSGFRTRRAELVGQGILIDSGKRQRGMTGRRMIVWETSR